MELTAPEREALDAIRLEIYGARYRPADWEIRPPTKAEYRAKRDRLDALKKAWGMLDRDTQWHLVSGLNAMWSGDAEDRLPEIASVVDRLLEDMKKPSGAPEQLVGLGRATALIWSAWCARQLGGDVPIGRAAVTEIGAAISSLFGIDAADAERRVRHALRDMEKDGSLPRRGTTRRD
ncbi:hypothetical protein BH09PSE4_BH09PSE4_04340 [soil metagenome]